ncbi:MAG TPA: histidine kinase [Thermoanaerobaculia bacterium]|nr:histidine kinase [Thermoanaerobaculia bacterium]
MKMTGLTPRILAIRIGLCWLTIETIYLAHTFTRRSIQGRGVTLDDAFHHFFHWLLVVAICAALLRGLGARVQEASLGRVAGLIVLGALALAVARALILDRSWYRLAVEFHPALIDVGVTFGAAYGMYFYDAKRRLQLIESQLESDLAKSELARLRAQLQPHFLFNTLNAISSRITTAPSEAQWMIGRLSELLRMTLHSDVARAEATVAAETSFTRAYLDLQRVRFGDRLEVLFDVDDDVQEAIIPTLVLQPLVENALRHGVERVDHRVQLGIAIQRRGAKLHVMVWNSGPGLVLGSDPGLGLANTRARLGRLYGDDAILAIANRAGGGVCAEILIPYRRERERRVA